VDLLDDNIHITINPKGGTELVVTGERQGTIGINTILFTMHRFRVSNEIRFDMNNPLIKIRRTSVNER
jgi:hypothetical protein